MTNGTVGRMGNGTGNPYRPDKIEYRTITSAELASGDYEVEYLIEDAMALGQPLIIAGAMKVLKTSFIIDAAISLSVAGRFLGVMAVPRACRVAVMTGESGLGTIQETAHRVCRSAGRRLEVLSNLVWSTDLPRFGQYAHMEALEEFLTTNEIEVLFLDPAYLCMPSTDSGNLFAQGELLRGIAKVCTDAGVTLALAHHTKKNTGRDAYDVPELADISWAGFAEFARQWWLIGRREKYEEGTGSHKLWLSIGGSAGHSARWAVDVEEGRPNDLEGRRWDVALSAPRDVRGESQKRRDEQKAKQRIEQAEADLKALVDAMPHLANKRGTMTDIRNASGLNSTRFNIAIASAIKATRVLPCSDIVKSNGQTYDGFKLAGEPDLVAARIDPLGHQDSPQQKGDWSGCPSDQATHQDNNPYRGLSCVSGAHGAAELWIGRTSGVSGSPGGVNAP